MTKKMNVDLRSDGLLWLINRTVFHPRGYALAMGVGDEVGEFFLMGDGSEPWSFDAESIDEHSLFLAANRIFDRAWWQNVELNDDDT